MVRLAERLILGADPAIRGARFVVGCVRTRSHPAHGQAAGSTTRVRRPAGRGVLQTVQQTQRKPPRDCNDATASLPQVHEWDVCQRAVPMGHPSCGVPLRSPLQRLGAARRSQISVRTACKGRPPRPRGVAAEGVGAQRCQGGTDDASEERNNTVTTVAVGSAPSGCARARPPGA